MASTRGERLRLARERKYKSARIAAKELGVAISTYGAHERAENAGGRDFGPEEAKLYGRRFGVTPEWLLTGRWLGPDGKPVKVEEPDKVAVRLKVPIVGYLGTGSRVNFYDVAQQGDLDEVEPPAFATRSTVAVDIRGDTLGPYFNRWLLFYDDTRPSITDEQIGEVCAVGLEDDRVLIKQVQRGRGATFDLASLTEKTMHDVPVKWAAKVNGISRRRT